jgi:hypothetical protein
MAPWALLEGEKLHTRATTGSWYDAAPRGKHPQRTVNCHGGLERQLEAVTRSYIRGPAFAVRAGNHGERSRGDLLILQSLGA